MAVNHFTHDTKAEVELVREAALRAGAEDACVSEHWAHGGDGAVELAKAVVAACEKPSKFEFLYPLDMPIKKKIETIATQVYNADGVDFDPAAEKQIAHYEKAGFGNLPINMAKTHLSLSHDPHLKGVPTGYRLPIREVRASVGAGFVYPLCGAMRTMPGLPSVPVATKVDIDEDGKVVGLF